MDSKFIQSALQKWLYDHNNKYQVLNYSASGYFEADVLAVTESRIVTEIEVKISLSDFKADFKKTHKHMRLQNPTWRINPGIANRFFYACPAGLLNFSHGIPAYAGLIWVDSKGNIEVVKKSPVLHKIKADDKLIIGMLNNLTQKSIYGGICKMTYDNNIRKIEFDKYERERKQKTADFILHCKNLRNGS